MGNNQCFKFVDLEITSAKKPIHMHLYLELDNGHLLLVDITSKTDLLISDDKGANWDTVETGDFTSGKITRVKNIVAAWHDRTNSKAYFMDWTTGGDITIWYLDLSDYSINVVGADVGDADYVGLDVYLRDGNLEVLVYDDAGIGGKNLEIYRWVDPNWNLIDSINIVIDVTGTSFVVDVSNTVYFFVDAVGSMNLYSFDGADFDILEAIFLYSASANINLRGIAYDDDNLLYMVFEKDVDSKNYLIEYNITGDSLTVLSEYNIALMLDRNNSATVPNEFEKAFDIARDANDLSRIWEIKPRKGGLMQLQSIILAQNIIAITDNFLMFANGAMYEYTNMLGTSQKIVEGKVNKGIFPTAEKGNFSCHPDDEGLFYYDDSIKVYDESDEMVLFAKIENKSRDQRGMSVFGLDAYNNELRRRSYVKTHAATTTHEKQQDNVDNACGFCHRDSSIVATTTDYLYEQDRPPMALFSLGRFMERQVGSASPNGLVRTEAYNGLTKAPQYYKATYGFKDDEVGGNPAGWTFDEVGGTINVIASFDGHKKVVEISRVDAQISMIHTFASVQANETVEFYLGVNDIGSKNAYFYLYEGANVLISLRFYQADIDEFDGGAWNSIKEDCIVANTPYNIKIILNDAANTYDLYLDGVLEGNNIAYRANSVTGMSVLKFIANTDDMIMYVDAVGFSHDVNYNVGDNTVAWNVEVNGSVDLIKRARGNPPYYVKKLGITRATCVGGVGISQTYADATLEDGKTVVPLKEYRDLRIEQNVEALQIATALFNIFSQETKFISIRVVDQEYVQPGYTVNFSNTGEVAIAEDDYLVLFYTYDWVYDVYDIMILTDNIVLLREFESYFDRSNLMTHQTSTAVRDNSRFTKEGGAFVKLTNKTGVATVKGSLVQPHTNDNSFELTDGDCTECFGVVYENGIADGDECKVVWGGRVEVLLKDATASTTKNWVQTSDVAGRADATGGSPAAAPTHFQEIGHCIETKAGDTDVLAFIMLHFL